MQLAAGTAGTHPPATAVKANDTDALGRVRLYSTKSFKPLGTLAYHKKNCQSIAFARAQPAPAADAGDEESDDEMTEQEKIDRTRWLVSGGQDSRVAIWSLINFAKT